MPDTDRPTVLQLAAARGYPRVPIRPAEHVAPGEANWQKFTECASQADVAVAGERLVEMQREGTVAHA